MARLFTAVSSHYIDSGTPTQFQITGSFTYGAWVNIASKTADKRIVNRWGGSTPANESTLLTVSGASFDQVTGAICNGTTVTGVNGTTHLATATWYHVAATYDGSTLTAYVNGVSDGSTAASGVINNPTGVPLRIGAGGAGAVADSFMDGSIAHPVVYNAALTAAQVLSLYNKADPRMVQGANLAAWYGLFGVNPEPEVVNNLVGTPASIGSVFNNPRYTPDPAGLASYPLVTGAPDGWITSSSLPMRWGPATSGTPPYVYDVQRAPDVSGSPGAYATIATGLSETRYKDAKLTANTKYWYRVVAHDAAGANASYQDVSCTTLP